VIVDNQGVSAASGTFSGLPEGAFTLVNGVTFDVSYVGGDGNDVVLSVVHVAPDAPVLDDIQDFQIDEGAALSVQPTASVGQSGLRLSYALVAAPAGATIDTQSGLISWQSGEMDGGQTYSIAVRVDASNGLYSEKSFSVHVREVNGAPSGADATVAIVEDDTYTIVASDFGFSDSDDPVDSFAGVLISSLPTSGVLHVGLQPAAVGDFVSRSDIDAGKLSFKPTLNVFGSSSFQFQVVDTGSSGAGDVNLDPSPNLFAFSISPVNDAPTIVAPGPQTISEGNQVAFSVVQGNPITIADIDATGSEVVVSVSISNGTLAVSPSPGIRFVIGTSSGGNVISIQGTLSSVNAALDGLVFTPDSGFWGKTSLHVEVNDLGNDGAGGELTATSSIDIFVVPLVKPQSALTLSISPAPSEFGAVVEISAAVSSDGFPVVSGIVELTIGGVSYGSSQIDPAGTARFYVSTLTVNYHQISATFDGDNLYEPSQHATVHAVQLTDDFNDGDFAGWSPSTFGFPGNIAAANGGVEFTATSDSLVQGGIVHSAVADGDFEASADFTENGADGGRWRHGIQLNFENGRVIFHDADGADKGWYLYGSGNTPLWSGNPGGSAGIEGTSTIEIRKTGDHVEFDLIRAGVESYLTSYDFPGLGNLIEVQSRAWAHDTDLDCITDNFRLVPIASSGGTPTGSFADGFSGGLSGWSVGTFGTSGTASASGGTVNLQGPASGFTGAQISKSVSVAGDFTFAADLTWAGSSGAWRQGLFLNFGTQQFVLHDSGEAGWYIYGPSGVLFSTTAGSGQSGAETLQISRSGDTLTFGYVRSGVYTLLFSTTQSGLGGLTQVSIAAWSHGIDLNGAVDNATLTVD